MWNYPAAPRSRRRPACAGCGRWKRPVYRGYHADLNAKALGFSVTGFVFVGLASQKDADLKLSRSACGPGRKCANATCCRVKWISCSNAWPTDLSAFQQFITDTLTAEKNVASVKSSLMMHASKREPGVPVAVPD